MNIGFGMDIVLLGKATREMSLTFPQHFYSFESALALVFRVI